jgi:RimJ/RimL family protein N-acetyltransferase
VQSPVLVGARVYLRPVELADAPTLAPWFNDPDVARYLLVYRPLPVHAEEEFIRAATAGRDKVVFGVAVREDDRLVGVAGLDPDFRCRSARFGIALGDKAVWGRGYGTEATGLVLRYAFETLNLNRVWLHVFEYNERARRVYEKVGFVHEGRLRQDTYRDGRYWDAFCMGILRPEWEVTAAAGR